MQTPRRHAERGSDLPHADTRDRLTVTIANRLALERRRVPPANEPPASILPRGLFPESVTLGLVVVVTANGPRVEGLDVETAARLLTLLR